MVRVIFGLMMVFGLATVTATAEEMQTREVIIHMSDAFVPTEPNSSGESYVVINGMYPSSCYRWNRAIVEHKEDNMHVIRAVATVTQGMCLTVMVPFSKEVILGKLDSGKHTLRFVNGDETYFERTMTVK